MGLRLRLAIEVVMLVVGLGIAYMVGDLSAWSYPPGRDDIWLVTYAAMAGVVALHAVQVRRVLNRHGRMVQHG